MHSWVRLHLPDKQNRRMGPTDGVREQRQSDATVPGTDPIQLDCARTRATEPHVQQGFYPNQLDTRSHRNRKFSGRNTDTRELSIRCV